MNLKSNKAITLVALIITIIILLILAGVSLSMVLGENGLINKAQSSVDKYKESSKNEQELLNKVEDYFNKLEKNESNKVEDKKEGEIELSATSGECTYPNTITFDVIKNTSGGDLSVKTLNEDIATATISGNTITVTPKNVDGTVIIKVTSAGTKEYKEKSVEYTLKVNKKTTYSNGETVSVGGYDFYVIGDDGTNVTLLCKTTIGGNTTWGNAKSQAASFGNKLGGTGRLMTYEEAYGVAENYRNIGKSYWLLTTAEYNGTLMFSIMEDGQNIAWYASAGKMLGIRPVVVISKSKLS